MAKKMYRQGDILFVETDEIPNGTECKDGIIARGEVTGHSHRIAARVQAVVYLAAAMKYIHAVGEAQVVHEEHGTIHLPPGKYQCIRQQEYTPEGWRQVED